MVGNAWKRRTLLRRALGIGLTTAISRRGDAQARTGVQAGISEEGSLVYSDPRLLPKPPKRGWLTYVSRELGRDYDYGPARDPKLNVHYPHRLQVECVSGERRERRFVVHFLTPEDEPLARKVGAVMARLYWISVDYLAYAPPAPRYTSIWLHRGGEPSGEEYRGNIYLHAIRTERAPAEWLRELAHEYAHLVLPRVGPYSEPEEWGEGYLGERLYLKWLLADNGQSGIWGEPIDAAGYVTHQIAPLRERFLERGPDAADPGGTPLLARGDAVGMYSFIGQVLALEAIYGPSALRAVWRRFDTPRPLNLPGYVARAFRELDPVRLTVAADAFVPSRTERVENGFRRATYRLLLPGGSWQIQPEGRMPKDTALALDGAALTKGEASGGWDVLLPDQSAAWHLLELRAPAGEALALDRITLTLRR
ncbi:MAG: hypothetical protein ACK47B_16545 [Armatimonadota bacterium]